MGVSGLGGPTSQSRPFLVLSKERLSFDSGSHFSLDGFQYASTSVKIWSWNESGLAGLVSTSQMGHKIRGGGDLRPGSVLGPGQRYSPRK